ncbi:MAG: hypothetical protein MSIBF_05530 [Candidatus Altiarchaeales archaeon IMC4]|nr:MAG: hypothetical protein MSIBF_05530 [Candidatus Altiarchaeales archaeon IMC4]
MAQVGTIHGAVKPMNFTVLLSTEIERGSYVKVNHETYGWVLARIDSVRRYMQSGEEVSIAEAKTIGYKQAGKILVPKTPFRAEERVHTADRDLITDVLGLRKAKRGSIYFGLLEGHDLPVYVDVARTIGKHVSVLAKTGAGKSYTVGVLLEELMKNKVPIVIIDPHGEYSSLKYPNTESAAMTIYDVKPASYADQIVEYTTDRGANPGAERLSLNSKFDLYELMRVMPMALNDAQKAILYDSLRHLEGKNYGLANIINVVQDHENKAKWKILSGLEMLKNSGIFDEKPLKEKDFVRDGMTSIINLKGTDPIIQQLIVAKIAEDLFEAKKMNRIPGFFFLVEEAHNFCPERGFGDALSSEILRTVASEGRKFGFSLCVVSQRPARIDKNVLSQCNTQIILKVTNPNDLRAIGQSIEGFTQDMENDIRQLPVGHALIVGCAEQPVTVDIRVRETMHAGKPPAEDAEEEKPAKKKGKSLCERIKPIFISDEPAPAEKKKDKSRLRSIFFRE